MAIIVYYVWLLSAIAISIARQDLHVEPKEIFRTMFHETRPFYWPAVIVVDLEAIINGDGGPAAYWTDWLHYLWLGCQVLNWYWFKNIDDDDRWKRRRAKALEAIKSVGARLIVVPVPQGAS